MNALRMYAWMSPVLRALLNSLARKSPFFKSNKGFEINSLELNFITPHASKKNESSRLLLEELTFRNFHFSKSIATNKYRYNLYNLSIVFLFVNKIEVLSEQRPAFLESLSVGSICETLFLHLKDEFLSQTETTSKFFTFFTKTCKKLFSFYMNKLSEIQNGFQKTKLLEKEFIVLVQYLTCDHQILSETADRIIRLFLVRYPFLFHSHSVLRTLQRLIDGLSVSLNKKFSADPLNMKLPMYDQSISFPQTTKDTLPRLGHVLEVTFTLYLNSKVQNEFLARKALSLFLNQINLKENELSASVSFFQFMDKTEEIKKTTKNRIPEFLYNAGLLDSSSIERQSDLLRFLIRQKKPKSGGDFQANRQPEQFPVEHNL